MWLLAVRAFAVGLLPPSAAAAVEPVRIDVDHASVAELMSLPGVGPARAEAIVLARVREGPFGSAEGLLRVPGVGPQLLHDLDGLIEFGGSGGAAPLERR